MWSLGKLVSFAFSSSPDGSLDVVSGNIRALAGKIKLTGFPGDHVLSVFWLNPLTVMEFKMAPNGNDLRQHLSKISMPKVML